MKTYKIISLLLTLFLMSGFISADNKIEQNKIIAKKFIEAWSTHDSNKLTSLFSSEGVYEEIHSGRKYTDKESIAAYFNGTLAGVPDSKLNIVTIMSSDTQAMVEWVWKGTNTVGWPSMGIPATNKYFELKGVSVMTIESNLIIQNKDYWDKNSFMAGIGVE